MPNDTFGHNEGDFALKTSVEILKKSLKSADIIGRLGGDKFVVIVDRIYNDNNLIIITERIQKYIEEFNKISIKPYNISITFGYSIFDKDRYSSFSQMMKEADKTLYSLKKEKKSNYSIIKTQSE
ncbi:MAG: GGDEF domain-containing protein [Spirochaetales bacterium]|nr:GGDEF domain-containing protein [Spirochaetales bacterium]